MLYLTVCLCLAASALAAPATEVVPLEKQQPTVIPIVSQSEEFEANGTYKFSYETGNGIKREESSYTKLVPRAQGRSADSNEGGESDSDEIHVQEGSYSYTAPDGTLISVRYIADENGFRPIGSHIPKGPSMAPSVSSAEKTGRALKAADNAEAGSVSAAKSVPKLEPRSGIAPENSKQAEQKTEAISEASTEGAAEASKTEGTAEASTTEGTTEASKTEGTTEAPNTLITKTTSAESEAYTTEAVSTTESSTSNSSTEASATEPERIENSTIQARKTEGPVEVPSTEAVKTDSTTEVAKAEAS